MTRLANRIREVAQFERLLVPDGRDRILLIKAPSSYGKSQLIDRFRQVCDERQHLGLIQLDLEDSTAGIVYLIARLQRKLRSAKFPNYERSIRTFLGEKHVEMSEIEIVGNANTLQILLNTDEQQRQLRFGELENSFFRDLEAIRQPTILLIDTFEKAPFELQQWLGSHFLAEVAERLHNFRVVIAGQEVPSPKADWRSFHHCCELTPIMEVDVWQEYARARGFSLSRDMILGVVHALQGKPRDIVMTFESLHQGLQL